MSSNSPSKIGTRSATAASKQDKLIQSSSTPLSADEFRTVIAGIQKAQEEMLASFKSLSLSQDKKHDVLKTSLDFLSTQIRDLKTENVSLRSDLVSLKERVIALETSAGNSPSPNAGCVPQLLVELSEREKCSFNVVVHGLPESSSARSVDRIADDIKLLSETIIPLALSLPTNLKSFRLGGVNAKRPRPLKIHFSAKEVALQFVNDFNASKRSYAGPSPTISVVRDRTVAERLEIRRIYAELEDRKKNGELGVAVRYKNGVPYILVNRSVGSASAQVNSTVPASSKN